MVWHLQGRGRGDYRRSSVLWRCGSGSIRAAAHQALSASAPARRRTRARSSRVSTSVASISPCSSTRADLGRDARARAPRSPAHAASCVEAVARKQRRRSGRRRPGAVARIRCGHLVMAARAGAAAPLLPTQRLVGQHDQHAGCVAENASARTHADRQRTPMPSCQASLRTTLQRQVVEHGAVTASACAPSTTITGTPVSSAAQATRRSIGWPSISASCLMPPKRRPFAGGEQHDHRRSVRGCISGSHRRCRAADRRCGD